MIPETSLLSVLPNLSVATVAIVAMVIIIRQFIQYLERRETAHLAEIKDSQHAIRSLEREVRESIMKQLGENTNVMSRVMDHFKRERN